MTRPELLAASARGILFSTEMVQAILEGRKTRTMRAIKPQPKAPCSDCDCDYCHDPGDDTFDIEQGNDEKFYLFCEGASKDFDIPQPKYKPGDIVYVREAFHEHYDGSFAYRASAPPNKGWSPSIHMPRDADRLFLRITGVKAQRPQELAILEIGQEGVKTQKDCDVQKHTMGCAECGFCAGEMREDWRKLWDSVQQKKTLELFGYAANPLCWVYEFEKVVPDG